MKWANLTGWRLPIYSDPKYKPYYVLTPLQIEIEEKIEDSKLLLLPNGTSLVPIVKKKTRILVSNKPLEEYIKEYCPDICVLNPLHALELLISGELPSYNVTFLVPDFSLNSIVEDDKGIRGFRRFIILKE